MSQPPLFRSGRRVAGSLLLAALVCGLCLLAEEPQPAFAQQQQPQQQRQANQTETRTGTLVEIKKKGRGRFLVVQIDTGEEMEFPLTPKVDFGVTAPGDASDVVAGNFISGKGPLTNDKIFLTAIEVRLAQKGRRFPQGGVAKAPSAVGESQLNYLIAGPIAAAEPDPENAGYHRVALKLPGRIPPVLLEPGFSVTVNSADSELATPGAAVELEVAPLRGGRFNLLRATVRLDEPFPAAPTDDAPKPGAKDDAPQADDAPKAGAKDGAPKDESAPQSSARED